MLYYTHNIKEKMKRKDWLNILRIRDKMKEKTFEVLTNDGDATLGFINAMDIDHALRIAKRLYCENVIVTATEPEKEEKKATINVGVRIKDYDAMWGVQGYYLDNDGNDIRDRD